MKKSKGYESLNVEKLERKSKKLIKRFSDPRDVKPIAKLSYDESYIVSKYYIVHELVKIGRAAIPSLVSELKHKNYLVRELAIRTLGEIGDRSITPDLISTLKRDAKRRVQNGAIRALQKLNKKSFSAQKRHTGQAQQDEIIRKWMNWWKENKHTFNKAGKLQKAMTG